MKLGFTLCDRCEWPTRCRSRFICQHLENVSSEKVGGSSELPVPKPLIGWPLSMVLGNFQGMRCEEASQFSTTVFIPCSKPVEALVWHERDRRAYMMCHMCASHNIMNRGGRLVIDGTKQGLLTEEVSAASKWKNWQNLYGQS